MLYRNRAVAGFDRTHNLQFYGNYELPFGPQAQYANSGVAAKIRRRLAGELDPEPDERHAVHGRHLGNVRERAGQYPDRRSGARATVAILGGHGVGQPYFDPLAFKPVTDVRFGNSGRNILRGPGVFNLDGSMFRNFTMTERFKLQVRAEMFGVTNTPQFGNPGATVSNMTLNADGSVRALERLHRDHRRERRAPDPVRGESARSDMERPVKPLRGLRVFWFSGRLSSARREAGLLFLGSRGSVKCSRRSRPSRSEFWPERRAASQGRAAVWRGEANP